jgi:hypothetical protein
LREEYPSDLTVPFCLVLSTDNIFEDLCLRRHSEVETKVHEEEHKGGDEEDAPAINGVATGHCAVASNGKRWVKDSGKQ